CPWPKPHPKAETDTAGYGQPIDDRLTVAAATTSNIKRATMTTSGDNVPAADPQHRVPDGVGDAVIEAIGKLTEALETTEQARGAPYALHHLSGSADAKAGQAVAQLREAGAVDLADEIEADLIGRNVLDGRWTFQVVEEYD